MPKALHDKLKKEATKMIKAGKLKSADANAYVYGTLNKIEKSK